MTANSTGEIRYAVSDRIAHIELHRPEKLNALTPEMSTELRSTFHRFELDPAADIAVLSGAGRAFCAGADTATHQESEETRTRRWIADPRRTLYEECISWKPIIAATHGYTVGYGMVLALKADLIVADTETKYQIAEIPRGLYGSGLWALTAFRSSTTFADELTLTAKFASASELLHHGVINAVAEPGKHVERALEYADAILSNPQLPIRDAVRCRRSYMMRYCADAALLARAAPLAFSQAAAAKQNVSG